MEIEQDKYGGKIFIYTNKIVSLLNNWSSNMFVDLDIAKKDIKKIKQLIKNLEEHIAEIEKESKYKLSDSRIFEVKIGESVVTGKAEEQADEEVESSDN